MHAFWLLVLSIISLPLVAQNKDLTNQADPDTDFLFLSEEEPMQGDMETDDELVIPPTKKHHMSHKRLDNAELRAEVHDSVEQAIEEKDEIPALIPKFLTSEDIESTKLVSPTFAIKKKNGEFVLSGRFRPEGFYGRNLAFLNDRNDLDAVVYIKHTADITGQAKFGRAIYGHDAAEFKFTLRNKGIWGNPASIAPTTTTSIKELDATFGDHDHALPRFVIWFRELWLKMSLTSFFNWDSKTHHYFIIGLYPFKLGHGIALGDAYAVNPGLLGFYSDNSVDQYAPGFLFTGELVKNWLDYNLYAAIFENKSDSSANVAEAIYSQRCGRHKTPARGFGHIDWLIAGNIEAVIFNSKRFGKLETEPYWLYNYEPELRIEFPADAKASLGTIGLELDYTNGNFEASFEMAKNFGKVTVFCWDRNQIVPQLDPTTAAVTQVNSQITDTTLIGPDGKPRNALDTKSNQAAINAQLDDLTGCIDAEALNGQFIPGTNLKNSATRFSNQFGGDLGGWMVVGDMGYWMFDKQFQIAAAAGIASGDDNPVVGDENPKLAPSDGSYDGFLGLQELWNGGQVESVYVLGQRKLPRPLSLPNDAFENDVFAAKVSEFTNIVYAGIGAKVNPNVQCKFSFRPNLLFYWQQFHTYAFSLKTQTQLNRFARNFLGTELNAFVDVFPIESMRMYLVTSIFFPGAHYRDIRGLPFNKSQLKIIQQLNNENDDDLAQLPLLGTDMAYSLNIGFEFKF